MLHPKVNETVIYWARPAGPSGRQTMLCSEQRIADATIHVASKFVLPGSSVMDPWFTPAEKAKLYLVEQKVRKIFRREVDSQCVDMMMASVLELFASRCFNKESDIKGDRRVEYVAKAFLKGQ